MGVRRFLNLFAANRPGCMYSLRRFDLSRNQFFYTTPEEVALHGRVLSRIQRDSASYSSLKKACGRVKKQQASEIGSIRLPARLFNMRPAPYPKPKSDELRMDAFALSERSIVFADRKGHVFTYDADSDCLVTMPGLHAPKDEPLAVSVPRPGGSEGGLYVIERLLRPGKSFQFEALVSGQHYNEYHPCRTWQCEELPLPSLQEDVYLGSVAVVGNVICISADHFGTYCFDTVSRSWSFAGDWVLPFFGTAEYVPELNLWFGVSDQDYHLPCAADLSPVLAGQRPEPGLIWADNYLPEEWHHSGQNGQPGFWKVLPHQVP
ncbi:hypothetical protein CFC21_084576 [Triticum aestivum]|uniref:DUF295 domain-containing protein n=2 Tax=Triticum aestivum TaxID=4565 RepID=A0A3B6NU64_WHEAT|nr:uncharacterized protein LOC123128458 isoform X1 [Triticum aestivum]KAF7080504.1 hypothetical protein CFC21_084576 [Triticum aestivum]